MKKYKFWVWIFFLIVIVALWYLFMPPSTSTSSVIPPEVKQYASDWPTANQNFSNTRAAIGSSINLSNISKLGLNWSSPITGVSEWGAATTNPLILGNTIYFQDLKSNIYAVDFNSGKQLWKKEYNLDIAGPAGVAVGYGKIFAIKGHYNVVALDLKGNELWSTNLSNNQNIGIDIQPVVYGNTVYISTVPGVSNENFYKGGSTGIIYALNAQDGTIKWSFNTVDTVDIWGNAKVNSGGGAWYPPAIDTATNLLYWGIGNPAPWPGTTEFPNGTSRPGNNLYTGSLIALNHMDGKLLWYNQVLPHDLFDYDLQISPILANVLVDGVSKDVIFGSGKMGKVYEFDRKSGKTIWELSVGTHLNDDLKLLPSGTTKVSPSPLGGVETVMAYSNGILFVPVVDMTVEYTPSQLVSKSFNLASGKGELVAIDVTTGKILWTNKFNSINVGAATIVNDVVFTSTYDGKIYAFNSKTGSKVWEYQAPGGINGWPAVKGDTIIFPVGLGKTPVLLSFKIGANLPKIVNPTLPAAGAGKGFQQ
jgi:glucose dehydrogenase